METVSELPLTIRVGKTDYILDCRDIKLLKLFWEYKMLTTEQIARILHEDSRHFTSTIRTVNRKLSRLKDLKLLASNVRMVGGVKKGSMPFIWHLAKNGHRVVAKKKSVDGVQANKAFKQPTYVFANHTLAINNTRIKLKEIEKQHTGVKLKTIKVEADCWIRYGGVQSGITKQCDLKPDIYTTFIANGYKYHWFVEVDLATESPVRIVKKCRQYLHYFENTEQKDWCCGVLPAVVWIVPTIKRRDSLRKHIAENLASEVHGIFVVITPSQFEHLVLTGEIAENEEDNHGD